MRGYFQIISPPPRAFQIHVNARTVEGFTPLGLVPAAWGAGHRAVLLNHGGVR